MLVVMCGVIALLSPLIAWRWPAGLVERRWRWPLLIWAVLAFQAVVIEIDIPHAAAATLHVLTYVAAIGFIWINRQVLGLWVVAVGAALNGLVIALNGGTLPMDPGAAKAAGLVLDGTFENSGIVENPVLPWLGDYFAWPAPRPFANTFSLGDVLIVVGVGVVAWAGSRRIGAPAPERARDADAGLDVVA